MSVQLLDKTRKINKLLHNNNSYKVVFNDICEVVGTVLGANVMVVSQKGKLLGIYEDANIISLHEMLSDSIGDVIDFDLNERFLSVLSTKENVNLLTLGFEGSCVTDYNAIIMPIDFAGERLGTTFLYRTEKPFDVDDIILSEYANTVVALEMMRSIYEENAEEVRKEAAVKSALSSLSVSEKEAIEYVFQELGKTEGLLVASRISAKYRLTRSIIVNAIKKLEGAGIIEARSSGMKGTYIKVINDAIYNEISIKE